MILNKPMLASSLAALLCGAALQPAAAASWVRGFVVGSYEYAFRYGGRAGYVRGAEIEPGVDCVHGSDPKFANPDQMRWALSFQPWRSKKEIEAITLIPGIEDVRDVNAVRFSIWVRGAAYRGYKHGIETYVNPFAAEDPGQSEVADRIGDGFNLDGKIGPNDFVSPDGERGIDNALYRAWGCDTPWRGNGNANLDLRANDKMLSGLYTVVIRISGNQDPMNDSDATIEIGQSPEKIVRDARADVAASYSYRILKDAQYTKLKARIKDGVVESVQVPELHAPRLAWFPDQLGDADFHQGRLRLVMGGDNRATALIGGYRDILDLYAENTFAQDGGQQGVREHEDHVALYYALRRNADAMPDPKTGRKMGISTAYRMTLRSAFVEDAEEPLIVAEGRNEGGRGGGRDRNELFGVTRAAFIKSTLTQIAQPVPEGSEEASFPNMERAVRMLPSESRDYFLKTLDRPYFPNGSTDNQGNKVDAEGNIIVKAAPRRPRAE
jgi:hypothetical protein